MITEEWEKDGQKQSRTICVVDKFDFCGSKGEATGDQEKQGNDDFMSVPEEIDKELPFN